MSAKKEVFFATSFSGHTDYGTGHVHENFKGRVLGIMRALREVGFAVYCAVEADGWRISQMPPGVSMRRNYENIDKRPIFLALVGKVGSDGRGLEVEHAYNAGSRVFLATGPGEELGWVMKEIVALGRAEHMPYGTPEELASTLKTATTRAIG